MATNEKATVNSDAVKAASDMAATAVKAAQELKARLDRAPKGADPALIKAAAVELVDRRWAAGGDVEKVAAALADPNTALKALTEIAKKAAEEIDRLSKGQSTEYGTPIATTKAASEAPVGRVEPVSEADVRWTQRMEQYRQRLNRN